MSTMPDCDPLDLPQMPDITIFVEGLEKLLVNLNPNKATGPDGVSSRLLNEFAHEIAPVLTLIYQSSIDTGILPLDWKEANISPIYKTGERSKASDYWPCNLPCEIIEYILNSHNEVFGQTQHKVLNTAQHGYRSGHSCEIQLIQTIHEFTSSLNNRTQTDVIIMDFSKAFDTVPHDRLLLECAKYSVTGKISNWLYAFLKNRKQWVVVGGDYSKWVEVESGVPQGTVLGPLLFLLYINDLPDNLHLQVRLFTNDCVVYRNFTTIKDMQLLQKNLESLSKWESCWQMSFNASPDDDGMESCPVGYVQFAIFTCNFWKIFIPESSYRSFFVCLVVCLFVNLFTKRVPEGSQL